MELTTTHKGIISLIVFVAGCLIVGLISGMTANSTSGYVDLEMPPLSPPGFLFPVAWTILYILMGISLWTVYRKGGDKLYYILFAVQLVLNFIWTPIFFALGNRVLAMVVLVALWATVAAMIYIIKYNKVAMVTLVPYILWLTFAAYLNIGAIILN